MSPPEPIVWTLDYTRRITVDDVQAAGLIPGTKPDKALYEQARDWLASQPLDAGSRLALRSYMRDLMVCGLLMPREL